VKLYEIAASLRHTLDEIAGLEELTPELSERLNSDSTAFSEKAEGVALYMRELSAQAETVEAEAARLAARARVLRNREAWLKSYLFDAMTATGTDKLPGRLVTLSLRNTPPRVEVVDESAIPAQFWKTPSPVLDRSGISDALKSGDVPGARLVRGRTLSIR